MTNEARIAAIAEIMYRNLQEELTDDEAIKLIAAVVNEVNESHGA